jgi:hypothetical protein
MRSRSMVLSLVFFLLLTVTPLVAAPRDARPDRTFDRIVRIIKKFVAITTGDAMIPPTP